MTSAQTHTQGVYPTAFKGYAGIVFTHGVRMGGRVRAGGRVRMGGHVWAGGQWKEACLGCISVTLMCKMLILHRDIGSGV